MPKINGGGKVLVMLELLIVQRWLQSTAAGQKEKVGNLSALTATYVTVAEKKMWFCSW